MGERKTNRKNGKSLSWGGLPFREAVAAVVQVKPPTEKGNKERIRVGKKGGRKR